VHRPGSWLRLWRASVRGLRPVVHVLVFACTCFKRLGGGGIGVLAGRSASLPRDFWFWPLVDVWGLVQRREMWLVLNLASLALPVFTRGAPM